MSTTPTQETPVLEPGKKYRFVVKSAEEAVRTIRERMGPKAKVLSVKQIGGQGLGKLLSSPKLEIIALIPEETAAPASSVGQQTPSEASQKIGPEPEAVEDEPQVQSKKPTWKDIMLEEEAAAARERVQQSALSSMLRRIGFDNTLLAQFEGSSQWEKLQKMTLRPAMAEFSSMLFEHFRDRDYPAVSSRVAFIGTPGTGKTTALCQQLTADVFIQQKQVSVVKLESDVPNSSDALSTFTEILGVNFTREPLKAADLKGVNTVYFDVPGVQLGDDDAWLECGQKLDRLGVDTRVLVLNAAYDNETMRETLAQGTRLGATHTVFTHLDELRTPGRLWRPLFAGSLAPYFLTQSPSVTDSPRHDVFTAMLETTFPRNLFN